MSQMRDAMERVHIRSSKYGVCRVGTTPWANIPHKSLEHFKTLGAIPKWGEPNIDPKY